ncbi:hypothetical protein HZF08_26690 [Paenibacillus sp. CGMCC 1.16610]|uniref:Uncharacterized protein n=1 Tax=Paenibacillus anseongense TaxID=2682845 RepID=A0ABW9U586_9BACL|nr:MULTISPECIES: hypothetical protein [Paenibacillus]MBA2941882.1 hypothetical protein [Paenibacillus sp. CGMCC 1.16610]MVQ34400.1 hypothetical protein [Paenibacillus anseongense]
MMLEVYDTNVFGIKGAAAAAPSLMFTDFYFMISTTGWRIGGEALRKVGLFIDLPC